MLDVSLTQAVSVDDVLTDVASLGKATGYAIRDTFPLVGAQDRHAQLFDTSKMHDRAREVGG